MKTSFFKDKTGKIIVWQTPNLPLLAWAFLMIANHFARSQNLAWLSTAFLFAWAFMEFYEGVNYFRRLLGLVVLVLITMSRFSGGH